MPEVLGELFAGIIFGPYALGTAIQIYGIPLVEFNEILYAFAEIGAIVILFIAGLEMSFARFKAAGIPSFIVGSAGVVVPFFLGYWVYAQLGFPFASAIMVGAALTATSIAITVRALDELGKTDLMESRITINAAVIDDILGLAVLSIVVSIVAAGITPKPLEIFSTLIKVMIIWLLLLSVVTYFLPQIINRAAMWKVKGSVEGTAIALCFGLAALVSGLGFSPIVGAFAAGMAVAESRAIKRVREFTNSVALIFSPIFFGVMGAVVNLNRFTLNTVIMSGVLILIALVSKVLGCGLPATLYFKDTWRGLRVGVGMISRGEVGIIIAGIGLTAGVLTGDIYNEIIGMIIVTTLLTPLLLKRVFKEE